MITGIVVCAWIMLCIIRLCNVFKEVKDKRCIFIHIKEYLCCRAVPGCWPIRGQENRRAKQLSPPGKVVVKLYPQVYKFFHSWRWWERECCKPFEDGLGTFYSQGWKWEGKRDIEKCSLSVSLSFINVTPVWKVLNTPVSYFINSTNIVILYHK